MTTQNRELMACREAFIAWYPYAGAESAITWDRFEWQAWQAAWNARQPSDNATIRDERTLVTHNPAPHAAAPLLPNGQHLTIHAPAWPGYFDGKAAPEDWTRMEASIFPGLNSAWHPIETAPTDGTMHVRGLHVFSSTDGRLLYWDAVVGHIDTEDGLFYDQGGDVCGWDAADFTHWCPLPEAPGLSNRGEGEAEHV